MCWLRFAPRAVLLQNQPAVGAPAPGANMCWLRFAPRAVLLQERNRGRSTRPGCENVLARFAPRRCSYKSETAVGAPAPGANECRPGANGVARVRYSLDELVLVPSEHSRARPGLRKNVQWRYFPGGARLPGVPRFHFRRFHGYLHSDAAQYFPRGLREPEDGCGAGEMG